MPDRTTCLTASDYAWAKSIRPLRNLRLFCLIVTSALRRRSLNRNRVSLRSGCVSLPVRLGRRHWRDWALGSLGRLVGSPSQQTAASRRCGSAAASTSVCIPASTTGRHRCERKSAARFCYCEPLNMAANGTWRGAAGMHGLAQAANITWPLCGRLHNKSPLLPVCWHNLCKATRLGRAPRARLLCEPHPTLCSLRGDTRPMSATPETI